MPETEKVGGRVLSSNAIHLVRTAQQVQYQLSQMADQKASILMGATFVIFTITIGQARGSGPPLPLLVLGGFAFLSAVLAVLAILPAIGGNGAGPRNLLFFGFFSTMQQQDYVEELLDHLASDEAICRTMAVDIYQNGRVLGRKKYRLLGYAYRVFLIGLTASLIAFVAQYAMEPERSVAAPAAASARG